MPKPPAYIAAEIKQDKDIDTMARIEAEMVILKALDDHPNAKYVYLYPEYLKTPEDIFNFGIYFGRWLEALENGVAEISPATKDLYSQQKAKQN